MNTTLKIGSTILVAGSIATGIGFGVQGSLSKPNTNEEIKKEAKKDNPEPEVPKVSVKDLIDSNFRPLSKNDDDNSKWDLNWDKFKEKYSSGNPNSIHSSWNFLDWESSKQLTNTPEEFKDKCTNNYEKNVIGKEDPLFVVLNNYCLIQKEEIQVD